MNTLFGFEWLVRCFSRVLHSFVVPFHYCYRVGYEYFAFESRLQSLLNCKLRGYFQLCSIHVLACMLHVIPFLRLRPCLITFELTSPAGSYITDKIAKAQTPTSTPRNTPMSASLANPPSSTGSTPTPSPSNHPSPPSQKPAASTPPASLELSPTVPQPPLTTRPNT